MQDRVFAQQLRPGNVVLQDKTSQMLWPPTHRSLTLHRRPQTPQLRTSVCSATHAPPQQLGLSAGQSSLVQHWLFGMHSSLQTFCPLGHVDSQRPLTQT